MNPTVRQYLVELEPRNPTEEPVHEQKLVSSTDPDATYATRLFRIGGGERGIRIRL